MNLVHPADSEDITSISSRGIGYRNIRAMR